MIEIRGDYGPISEWANINLAFASAMSSEITYANILRAMKISTTSEFDLFADAQARSRPEELNHVYEWGELGQTEGRLWAFLVTGGLGVKNLDYTFLPSVRPVPVGAATKNAPEGDTRKAVHIFHWKAAIGEHGMLVTIRPKNAGGVLAFPADPSWTPYSNTHTTIKFSRGSVNQMIGQQTAGKFASIWDAFWESGVGTKIVIEDIVEPTERQLPIEFEKMYRSISPSTPRSVKGFKSFSIGTHAKRGHKTQVDSMISKLISGYLARAREREALSGATSLSD